jgi:uncharacterized RDD family membrane protein YckC
VVFIIPFFAIVELIVLMTNAEKRRLGDQWFGTKVVAQPDHLAWGEFMGKK